MSALAVYRAATDIGGPLIRLYLMRRRARGKEDPVRFPERLGQAGRVRPPGPLIWAHAASVGESLSLLPVIHRLREGWPDHGVLLTTGTRTSARLMGERLPDGAFHQYIPVDRRPWVRGFLDHWRPNLALWAESEFWPNLLTETAMRGVPLILLNGRISERSHRGWKRHPKTIRWLLAGFPLCLAQSEADAARLGDLGAPHVACPGNLKFAAEPLPADPQALAELEAALGDRPRWLAASTHPGEETMVAAVHQRLRANMHAVLTLIVPRHPERGPAIAAELTASGCTVAVRSRGDALSTATDVYLADTVGELGLFYRLAPVAFIGKSLGGRGGQNPLEAAQLDCALVTGPHMENFADIAARLEAAGATSIVNDGPALAETVRRLLETPDERRRRAEAALAVAGAEAGVLDAVMEALAPYLPDPAYRPSRARA